MWCIPGNPLQKEETGEIYDVERIPNEEGVRQAIDTFMQENPEVLKLVYAEQNTPQMSIFLKRWA